MSGKIEYTLSGLSCSHCASVIEDRVNRLPWVNEARINMATQILSLNAGEPESVSRHELQSLVDSIESGITVENRENGGAERRTALRSMFLKRIGEIGGALIFLLLVFTPLVNILPYPILFFALAYILAGRTVLTAGFRNLGHGRLMDENFLMIIATAGAFAIGDYPEAVAVMLFYQLGAFFQDMAVDHSRRSIRNLMGAKPDGVLVLKGERVIETAAEDVEPGTPFLIRPGDRVALDAVITEGRGNMDVSALTGESYHRQVEVGDTILSGFINTDALIRARSLKSAEDSAYARIIRMVEDAGMHKARAEQFITRFARIYTPVIVGAALLLAVLPPLLIEGAVFREWFYRALVFLVVSCPCALVISIPLGFFAGIGKASREGILVKGGNYLEALNRVDSVFLDKTGTLTEGRFLLREIRTAGGWDEAAVLEAAAAAESGSTHPIAVSILRAWSAEHPSGSPEAATEIRNAAGAGIRALWKNRPLLIGKAEWLKREGVAGAPDQEGGAVLLAWDGEYRGSLYLSDRLRKGSADVISSLKKEGISRIVMLTGDSATAASALAQELPLDGYRSDLLPEDKLRILEEAASEGRSTLFAGDGINDAPVLARADVGVAMGGLGADAAIEAADIVLMSDDLNRLRIARTIARKTRHVVVQNIVMALGIKAVILALAAGGYAGMGWAVFGDVGVALLAVLNVLRIMSDRGPTSPNVS